jgi:response regulator RpfG family c-di-GMP phosphodiesterase
MIHNTSCLTYERERGILGHLPTESENRCDKDRSRTLVLIVDDEPLILRALRRALGTDYQVITADNGGRAIQQIREQVPAVALVDYELPDMKGVEVLSYLRDREPSALRVLMSGSHVHNLDAYRESDLVQAFFAKPVCHTDIMATIGESLVR